MQNIVIDISKRGVIPPIIVTEYDSMSRFFELRLLNNGADYVPPENANYSVWYETNDSKGWYDTITLPDETSRPAVVEDGNVLTVEIAEAATTSCGELAVMVTGDGGYQLTVTGIRLVSADVPGYDGEEVENYYNVYITRMQENAARAENAADIAVAYGATVEVDEDAQQLNITHHSDTEGGVGWLFGSAVTSDAEGSVAAFADGANDVAVKSLVAEITPVQSGSGDPSPTNIRPISGRTGMTVTRAGKNLLPNLAGQASHTTSGITWTYNDDGTITVNGTATGNVFSRYVENFYLKPGTYKKPLDSYVQYIPPTGAWTLLTGGGSSSTEVTITEEQAQYPIVYRSRVGSGETVNNKVFYPYLYLDSESDTSYEPYNGQTISVTWESIAGTVYGGTLDVVSGVLTVDRAIYTGTWAKHPSYNTVFNTPAPATYNYRSNQYANCYCNCLPAQEQGTTLASLNNTTQFRASDRLYASVQNITTLEDFQAWVAANELQLCYQLATPQTYQLTPTEVRTILGGNTIYTDAGDVSVEYIADTKLYIDNKIAELQALVLEN